MSNGSEQFLHLTRRQQKGLQRLGPIADLHEHDAVMVAVFRADGSREIHFPQLGLLTEGRIEHAQMDMYRGLMRARAEQAGSIVSNPLEEDDAA